MIVSSVLSLCLLEDLPSVTFPCISWTFLLIAISLVTHHWICMNSCAEKKDPLTIDCRLQSVPQLNVCGGDVKTHKRMKKTPHTQTNTHISRHKQHSISCHLHTMRDSAGCSYRCKPLKTLMSKMLGRVGWMDFHTRKILLESFHTETLFYDTHTLRNKHRFREHFI